jgi:hypothetical protein
VHRLIIGADPQVTARILTGLSSGEGLIHSVRDGKTAATTESLCTSSATHRRTSAGHER